MRNTKCSRVNLKPNVCVHRNSRCQTASAMTWYSRDRSRQRRHSTFDQHTQTHILWTQHVSPLYGQRKIITREIHRSSEQTRGRTDFNQRVGTPSLAKSEHQRPKKHTGMHKRNATANHKTKRTGPTLIHNERTDVHKHNSRPPATDTPQKHLLQQGFAPKTAPSVNYSNGPRDTTQR